MRAMRLFVIIGALVGMLAAAPAAFAAGKAPGGNGLFLLSQQQDVTITNMSCDDGTTTDHLVARGGVVGWSVGNPDRMYVLTSVSGAGTAVTPTGSTQYTFGQSYGRKSGLEETLNCTLDYAFAYGDVSDTGIMDVTLVRVW